MSTVNDLYGKLIALKNAIISKGGTVTVANTNPSPDELIAGVSSISGITEVSTMPAASSSTMGTIYRYTGATTVDYSNGKYYITRLSNGTYSWVLVNETDIPASGKAMLIIYAIKADGTVLSNATVTVTDTNSNTETLTTDANGKASIEVNAGTYTVEVSETISGYTTPTSQSVTVAANEVDYTYMIYVPSISTTFGNNSPAVISAVSETIAAQQMTAADVASTYGWNLGDTVDITLKNNETIQMRIIGINHDTLSSDHTTKAGLTLQMVNCLATKYAMNDSNTNAGGWQSSKMKVSTMPTLLALLPDEWQAVIKTVDKKSANGGSSNYSATVTTSENLFLLAGVEIFGSSDSYGYAQDGANEGTQYAYWASHNTANDRIKYYDNAGTLSATNWWERSSYYGDTGDFCYVSTNGSANGLSASGTRGVAFGFCV